MERKVRGVCVAALAMLCWAEAAPAVDLGDSAELHGYGSQDYLQATHNTYLNADSKGSWDDNFLGLVGTVTLNDASKLWAQLETSTLDATRFTWFFVDYQFSDTVRAHVGRVRYPLGLYNEIIDSKFLQQSSLEPALYQQAADMVHDSYTGAGVDYRQSLGANGSILWQAYGGNTYDEDPPVNSRDRRAGGGRVTYQTPVDGLRFMVSGYYTDVEILATQRYTGETRWIVSGDYLHGDWDIKSEYGAHSLKGVDSYAYYAQVGRNFGERFTVFARYDRFVADKSRAASDSYSQRIFVAGLNYKLSSNISLRLENQFNHGYALPVASGEMAPGSGRPDWDLIVAGVHFIF
jgi:predicted porin